MASAMRGASAPERDATSAWLALEPPAPVPLQLPDDPLAAPRDRPSRPVPKYTAARVSSAIPYQPTPLLCLRLSSSSAIRKRFTPQTTIAADGRLSMLFLR